MRSFVTRPLYIYVCAVHCSSLVGARSLSVEARSLLSVRVKLYINKLFLVDFFPTGTLGDRYSFVFVILALLTADINKWLHGTLKSAKVLLFLGWCVSGGGGGSLFLLCSIPSLGQECNSIK